VLLADLPGTIHLVAEAPQLDVPRLPAAVPDAHVAPVGAARMIDVFEEAARLVDATRTEIDGEHHLRADARAPIGEFVDTDGIALGSVPGEIKPHRAILAG